MDVFSREIGVYAFERFRLDPVRRTLLRDGMPVKLGARLLNTLLYLVANHDRLVERDELQQAVWQRRAVDENSLGQAISALRKILQADAASENFIVTVVGRGYRFGAPVEFLPAEGYARAGSFGQSERDEVAVADVPPEPHIRWPGRAIRWATPAAAGGVRSGLLAALAVSLLVTAGILVAIGSISRVGWRAEAPPPLSIVVMPFRYLGADRGSAYLADILTDDLTTYLADIPRSLVIARSSAEALNGRSAQEIGRALHVRYLVEGSVQADNDGMHIGARLIDANDGRQIWTAPMDGAAKGGSQALALMTRRMVSALDRRLMDAEATRGARERPNNPTALDQFFRARSTMDRAITLEDFTRAQTLLEDSVKAEPDFVEALSSLGWLLVIKGQSFEYPTYAADLEEAKRVVGRALALAPADAGALAAQGRIFLCEGNYEGARVQFDTALRADPAYVPALVGLALHAWFTGQPAEVIAPMQAALRIDPLGTSARSRYELLGLGALFAGHAQQAVDDLLRADHPESNPPTQPDDLTPGEESRVYLIAAYGLAGNTAEARRRYQAYSSILRHRTVWRLMTYLPRQEMRTPDFGRVADALAAAGMPRFADETEDDGATPTQATLAGGNFTPTPRDVTGAETISTARLRQMMAAAPAPIILDVGSGVAVPAGAIIVTDSPVAFNKTVLTPEALDDRLKTAPLAPVVVMSSGPFGVDSYNLVHHLIAKTKAKLYWYRGGEEAWAAAGLPAEDRRMP